MTVFEQLAVAWQAIRQTFARIGRPEFWAPFALLGVLQLGVVGGLWWFAHPAMSWLMAPVLRRVGGDALLHYPNLFRRFAELYARADLVLGATVGSVVVGARPWN